jgi:hypothetical protein
VAAINITKNHSLPAMSSMNPTIALAHVADDIFFKIFTTYCELGGKWLWRQIPMSVTI